MMNKFKQGLAGAVIIASSLLAGCGDTPNSSTVPEQERAFRVKVGNEFVKDKIKVVYCGIFNNETLMFSEFLSSGGPSTLTLYYPRNSKEICIHDARYKVLSVDANEINLACIEKNITKSR